MKNINEAKTIEEIAEIRRYKNEADKINNDRSSEIISNLYSSSSFHFVFELIQNAEDAKATIVEFFLKKDCLYFVHDGRPFDIDDIKSITNYGDSTKGQIKDKIGKFGIGFKSVFQVTETPEIYSPTYSFKLENKNIPVAITNNQNNNKTTFVFPFKENTPINLLRKEFNDINEEIILFLKNIRSIAIYIDQTKKVLSRETDNNFAIITKAITENRIRTTFEDKYLFFSEPACTNENFNISVAYKCLDDGAIDTKQQSKFVNVFFPTQINYGLKFYVNAPFETTPTRESIKSTSESETNNKLFEQLVELYGKSILKIRDLNLITPKFLEFLPISWSSDQNKAFFDKTKFIFKNEAIIPTSQGKFEKGNSLALTDKGIIKLIDNNLLEKLTEKKAFVSSEITYDKTRGLYYFLKNQINVPEYNFSSLSKKLTFEILQDQSDDWLKQYYIKAIHDHKSESYIFKDIPIIRTESNQQVYAKNKNGMPNVYICHDETLKPEQKIKSIFLHDNDCLMFFESLGITKPDETTKLPNIFANLERLKKDKIDEYFVWFDKLNEIYLSYKNQPEKQKHLLDEIRDKDILFDNATFLNNEITRKLYESHQLVDPRFKENTNELLLSLGKKKYFNVILKEGNEWDRSKFEYLHTTYAPYKKYEEHIITNFNLKEVDYKISKLFIDFIINLNNDYFYAFEKSCKRRNGYWSYNPSPSKLREYINSENWIADKQGKFHKINEFTLNEFIEFFKLPESIRTHDNINLLNFKSDIYDQLDEKDQNILNQYKLAESYGIDVAELIKQEIANKQAEKENQISQQIETEETYSFEINDEPITYTGLSPAEIEEKNSRNTTKNYNTQRHTSNSSTANLKEHGFRGEKIALEALFDKYKSQGFEIDGERGKSFIAIKNQTKIEVIYHNDETETYGYDIEIKENDLTIELIEVKSHTTDLINISGTQWSVAKNSYEAKTVKYSLYLVSKKTDDKYELNTALGNPYEGWVDGKIFATPVNIRI